MRLGSLLFVILSLLAACSNSTEYVATYDTDLERKPGVQVPDGDPPDELVVQDVVEGEGPAVGDDSRIAVHYVGVSWTHRTQIDSSWEGGSPVVFTLDGVIRGWREGLRGMRVGGRRALIIPPELAYGDDALIFVIDLHSVEAAPAH